MQVYVIKYVRYVIRGFGARQTHVNVGGQMFLVDRLNYPRMT